MTQLPAVWYQQDGSLCYKDGAVIIEPDPPGCVCGGGDPAGPCCQFPYSAEPNTMGGGVLCNLSGTWSLTDLDQLTGANGTVEGFEPQRNFNLTFNVGGVLTAQSNGANPPCWTYDLFTTTPGAFNGGLGRLFGPLQSVTQRASNPIPTCQPGFAGHVDENGDPIIVPDEGPFPYVFLSYGSDPENEPIDYYLYLRASYNPIVRQIFVRVQIMGWTPSLVAANQHSIGNAIIRGILVNASHTSTGNYNIENNPHYIDAFTPDPEGLCVDCVNITINNPLHTNLTVEGHIKTGCDYPITYDLCPEPGQQLLTVEKKRESLFDFTFNLNGFHACDPVNIPPPVDFLDCDLNPPPPPPPPPPPAECCTQPYSCQPTDAESPRDITLIGMTARAQYRVVQPYSCNQPSNPSGYPQTGSVSRLWDQSIVAGLQTLSPTTPDGVCPRYEKELTIDYPMHGFVSNGCSAGGFAIAPTAADDIVMRLIAKMIYLPGSATMALYLRLLQITAGGGNPAFAGNPYQVLSLSADLRGGFSPPYGGECIVAHRGQSTVVPGPIPPGGTLPAIPSSPPGAIGDPNPGVFGGWKIESYTSFCHTGLKAVGNVLLVPTGNVVRGSGTTRDDVYFTFSVEADVSGLEQCPDTGQTAPLTQRTPERAGIVEAAMCPACGGERDYSRCGAPCKRCQFKSGCGGM